MKVIVDCGTQEVSVLIDGAFRDALRRDFEEMLGAEGTDELFCKAVMNFRKAGYLAQEDAAIIGMITLDALLKHKTDRQGSILFMAGIIKQFVDEQRERRHRRQPD